MVGYQVAGAWPIYSKKPLGNALDMLDIVRYGLEPRPSRRNHQDPGSEPRRSTTTLPFSAQSTKACRGVGRGCQLVRSTFSKCASAAGSLQPLIAA